MTSSIFARTRALSPSRIPLVFALCAGAALFPAVAMAQDDESEPEIVVTAPLEGSRIESLQGAEVLRRDDIVEQLNGGLGDTLDSVPGIATTFFPLSTHALV